MTGYSVSGVAHGEQVNIRDGKSRVKRVGKYSAGQPKTVNYLTPKPSFFWKNRVQNCAQGG